MSNNARIETLKKNGADTSKYFTITFNENVPAGTKLNIYIENPELFSTYNEVANQILEDGYVNNTKLHRRFVAAHYMRMLESQYGWHGYLNKYYGYMYQFDMMLEEVRVLGKLENKDRETFNERKMFFTFEVVNRVLDDYVRAVRKYMATLCNGKHKKCHGREYVYVPSIGNVFIDDIETRVINPIVSAVYHCRDCHSYTDMYNRMVSLKRVMIKLPYETRKSKNWVDAFQGEGAFYTLKNLIMFHDVLLYHDRQFYDKYNAMEVLTNLAERYEGYQLNALLKETIKQNNFNFWNSVRAHQ